MSPLAVLLFVAALASCGVRGDEKWPVKRDLFTDDECGSAQASATAVQVVLTDMCQTVAGGSIVVQCTGRSGSKRWNVTEFTTPDCTGAASPVWTGGDETKCDNSTLSTYRSQSVHCGTGCGQAATCSECISWTNCRYHRLSAAVGNTPATYVCSWKEEAACSPAYSFCPAGVNPEPDIPAPPSCDTTPTAPPLPPPLANGTGGANPIVDGGGNGGGYYDDGGKDPVPAIVGVTLGGVALIGLGFGAYWYYFRRAPVPNTTSNGLPHPEAMPMAHHSGVTVVNIDSAKLA